MDKTKTTILLFICFIGQFISGCKGKYEYDRDVYNMEVQYNPWIILDFNTQVVTMEFHDFMSKDTLNLSETDVERITVAFNEAKIGKMRGEVYYGELLQVPSSDLKIKLFKNKKKEAEIYILNDYNINNPFQDKDNLDNNIIRFRDEFKDVLESNEQFKDILRRCKEQQRKSGEYLF